MVVRIKLFIICIWRDDVFVWFDNNAMNSDQKGPKTIILMANSLLI